MSFFCALMKSLEHQTKGKEVEILWLGDNKLWHTGMKRQALLFLANGQYTTFIDDDDRISDHYVDTLLAHVGKGYDAINFGVMCSVDGETPKPVLSSVTYCSDKDFVDHYERLPSHIMCIRRELAVAVGFKDMQCGEDRDFAVRLKPMIQSEICIPNVLYHYDFNSRTTETQQR
jgi:hypothetical protein